MSEETMDGRSSVLERLLVIILLCLHLSEVLKADEASKVKLAPPLDWRSKGKPLQQKPY